jgi:hypothetical protein
MNGRKVKIATIDTMLSFYLAFLYAHRPYDNEFLDRILCMSKFLFDVQQKNRLAQKGLLKRFSITCYGHQESVEEMKAEKAAKYKEFKETNNRKLFEEWFLSYKPDELKSMNETKKTNVKRKRISKSKKTGIFKIYGSKTRKNKKG